MKVYYPGPDPETFHPRLRRLVKDEVFELDEKTARLYIDGGLLRPAEETKPATGRKPKTAEV
ncbi:MAG: hypothetical protein ACYCYR_09605 [Desulfobulbaceae bacterium]|jgi:hypothetical protein